MNKDIIKDFTINHKRKYENNYVTQVCERIKYLEEEKEKIEKKLLMSLDIFIAQVKKHKNSNQTYYGLYEFREYLESNLNDVGKFVDKHDREVSEALRRRSECINGK